MSPRRNVWRWNDASAKHRGLVTRSWRESRLSDTWMWAARLETALGGAFVAGAAADERAGVAARLETALGVTGM